jgi:hypothetical protein
MAGISLVSKVHSHIALSKSLVRFDLSKPVGSRKTCSWFIKIVEIVLTLMMSHSVTIKKTIFFGFGTDPDQSRTQPEAPPLVPLRDSEAKGVGFSKPPSLLPLSLSFSTHSLAHSTLSPSPTLSPSSIRRRPLSACHHPRPPFPSSTDRSFIDDPLPSDEFLRRPTGTPLLPSRSLVSLFPSPLRCAGRVAEPPPCCPNSQGRGKAPSLRLLLAREGRSPSLHRGW